MKKKVLVLGVLLVLVAATAVYVGNTYAKYISSYSGNTSVEVADWVVEVNNQELSGTPTVQNLECTFDPATTDVVVKGLVAPGRKCYVDVAIDPTGTEVEIDYSIAFGTPAGGTLPVNMIASAKSNSGTSFDGDNASDFALDLNGTATGTIALPGAAGEKIAMTAAEAFTVRYALEWPYETTDTATNDPEDTADGITAANLTIPVTVTLTQGQ